jgi:hypothetical protein
MAIRLKIMQGETPKSGKSLCVTCKRGSVVRGQNCEEIVFCQSGPFDGAAVPFRISECASYHPVNVPWLHEMHEMAWKIEARKRGPAGFGEGVKADENEMEIIVTPPKKRSEPDWYDD